MDIKSLRQAPEKSHKTRAHLLSLHLTIQAFFRRFHIGFYECGALIIILLAMVMRLRIVQQDWPALDSDEATTGLMALHILKQGAPPLVVYGQDAIGTLDAYLAAFFFHIFGPSTFALRLGMVLLFTLFLVCIYRLTSLLYSKGAALFVLVVLSLGTPEIFYRELQARGGYGELLFFGALMLLLASWLALTSRQGAHLLPVRWRRALVYMLWSFIVGLALWSDPLILPFILTTALLLLIFCRSELRVRIIALLILSFLLGVAPQLLAMVTRDRPSSASASGRVDTSQSGTSKSGTAMASEGTIVPVHQSSLLGQIEGSVLISIPLLTGGSAWCTLKAREGELDSGQAQGRTTQCGVVYSLWGLGYLALLGAALMAAYRRYWYDWKQSTRQFAHTVSRRLWLRAPAPAQPYTARAQTIRHAARFMVLLSALLTWFIYTLSPQASFSPWTSASHLTGLLIATAALSAFLWETAQLLRPISYQRILRAGACSALLLFILTTFGVGTYNLWQQIPGTQAENLQQLALLKSLQQLNAHDIYADTGTCDRVAFQSLEDIRCSVLNEQLGPGLNRYKPSSDQVAHAAHPFYVFPLNSDQDQSFAQRNNERSLHYIRAESYGYAIYIPQAYAVPI